MSLELRYVESAALPTLAWCARIDRASDRIAVLHGRSVEVHRRGFVEGAWDGDFVSHDIAEAAILCGTAGWLEGDRMRFSASTDQSGPIFSIENAASLYVSNSPAFVMAAAGEEPDEIYPFYPYDLLRIFRRGLACQAGRARLSSARRLGVHYTTIMSVEGTAVSFAPHILCDSPPDYASYKALLVEGTKKTLANAADPGRRLRYRPLAALSRGYDSTAAAVVARAAGCAEALTFVDPRLADPHADSGADNARALGMSCIVRDRWRYLELEGCEAEFAYAATGSSAPLAAAEDNLAGRILITGEAGDAVWDVAHVRGCTDLARPWIRYTMGLSPIEFRLRLGYIAFAPACIAARQNAAIYAIATSDEMRPWSVGGDYDRPIPRRIAEEGGLARERFGTRKLATGHTHLVYPGRFSAQGLADYRRFLAERDADIAPAIYAYWRGRAERRHRLFDAVEKQWHDAPDDAGKARFRPPLPVPWQFMFTFQWAVASMRGRYARALAEDAGMRSTPPAARAA